MRFGVRTFSVSFFEVLIFIGCSTSVMLPCPRAVAEETSLKRFTGLWAPSKEACQKKLSGALDKENIGRREAALNGVIGICSEGVDVLYQAVNCSASDVAATGDKIEFRGSCMVKDYPPSARVPVTINVKDADHIEFVGPDFEVQGSYVRCSNDYHCVPASTDEPLDKAAAGSSDALAVVTDLYKTYAENRAPAFIPMMSPRALAVLKAQAANDEELQGEISDFGLFFDGQDWRITDVTTKPGAVSDDRAEIAVDFKNFDHLQSRIIKLVRQDGRWLIDDVIDPSGGGATSLLPDKDAKATQAATTPPAQSPPTPADFSTFKDCPRCPEMVALPKGSYLMGASPEDRRMADRYTVAAELPQHRVTLDYGFAIAKYQVTVEEFAAYVDETGATTGGDCLLRLPDFGRDANRFSGTVKPGAERYPGIVTVTDATFRHPGNDVTGRQPATCISYSEAEGYLAWLSKKTGRPYRLPTEAEWEYAARAGTTTPFYFGNNRAQTCANGNFADKASPYNARVMARCAERPSPSITAEVGSYKPNPWGLYDMVGNAFEITQDCAPPNYEHTPSDGSPYLTPNCQVVTGRGYFFDSPDVLLRSAARCLTGDKEHRANTTTFRPVVSLSPTAWDLRH